MRVGSLLLAICETIPIVGPSAIVAVGPRALLCPRLRELPRCLLAVRSAPTLQAHLAVARMAEQPPASTAASLLEGTTDENQGPSVTWFGGICDVFG